ncbi:MAG TPA: VOC family protein [Caulobacteraceae bacterium]|nr:VOC family protein [Caulobacteraceae bacterium]
MDLKLGKIAQIANSVSDVDAAEAFYEQALGLKKLFRPSPDMVFFDCGGVRLYLQKAHQPDDIAKASLLYLQCEDIAVAAAELKRRSVEFVDEPHRIAEMPTHDLWMTFFKDPDGHLLALEMQAPKGWSPG